MDGMQCVWWEWDDENYADPSNGSHFSFTFNYPKLSVIAEIAVAGFSPLLVTNDHDVFPGFTGCTWVDGSGMTHVEDFVSSSSFSFPVTLVRNGVTSLSGEVDVTAMMARINLNVFFWPSVTY